LTSSFHVVGTIFDRVWIDGNPDNQFHGMQTVLLVLIWQHRPIRSHATSRGGLAHALADRSEGMLQTDPIAKEMLAKYKIPMPNQNSSDEELKSYIAYFKWADQNLRPRGTAQPQPAAPGAARGPDETPPTAGAAGSPQPPLPPSPH